MLASVLMGGLIVMGLQEGAPPPLAGEELELLGGRLLARFPEGAKLESRRRGIMAAPESVERESRVVWTSGEGKLVVMTYELFETGGADVEKEVRSVVAGWEGEGARKLEVKAFDLKTSKLPAFSVLPSKLDLSQEAVLVLGLFVVREDRTVQYMAFYVNPALGKDAALCATLARRIAETVVPGKKTLASTAGRKILYDLGAKMVVVDLPAGFVQTSQEGPDFTVVSLTKLSALGGRGSSLNAYFGGHPGYQHEQRDDKPAVKEEEGTLLGAKVRWHGWSVKEGKTERHVVEAMIPVPESEGIILHAFAVAGDAEALKALRTAMQTLRVENKK